MGWQRLRRQLVAFEEESKRDERKRIEKENDGVLVQK